MRAAVMQDFVVRRRSRLDGPPGPLYLGGREWLAMNHTRAMTLLSTPVLVLNQNYEPLSVCTARRAVVLVYLGKAEIIEPLNGQTVHSVSATWPVPSIVRLGLYVNRPRKKILLSRKNIIKRDGHRCQYCGQSRTAMTVDHVVPKNHGGQDSWENLVCACIRCNNKKGDRTPDEANMPLRRPPRRPNHITFIQRFIGLGDHRWKRYLFLD
jgi:5-methylcytosine-specific restriction endonuclease McrA